MSSRVYEDLKYKEIMVNKGGRCAHAPRFARGANAIGHVFHS